MPQLCKQNFTIFKGKKEEKGWRPITPPCLYPRQCNGQFIMATLNRLAIKQLFPVSCLPHNNNNAFHFPSVWKDTLC